MDVWVNGCLGEKKKPVSGVLFQGQAFYVLPKMKENIPVCHSTDPQKYNEIRKQWERQKRGERPGKEAHAFSHPITVSITLGGKKEEAEEAGGLPEAVISRLKQILTGDFYFIQEIQDVFMDEFPDEKVWKLNAHAIEQLGFFAESNYAISDRFLNAASYFSALLGQDVGSGRGFIYAAVSGFFYWKCYRWTVGVW